MSPGTFALYYTGNVWVVHADDDGRYAKQIFTGRTRDACLEFVRVHYPDFVEAS